ncbi:uroporphyrinogen-III C-methyltransferase [Halalkalibacter kiskunsagensis]|uniref:uroporphyrinogen-III C-methyltransferase n=1 Tax=Halalkalibacter kiskunsagensis TaxID=1548599 RepID=A0ABV6KJA0_9BACI
MNKGYVFLVGAGPGDIRLMTVKGQQCLEKADVVLYDRLVNPLLLEATKPGAELVYCGKLPDRHLLRQEAINDLLVTYGLAGKVVVRLKGGDPSVFGRVGEEACALDKEGIPYEIIPGITAGIGATTYAGVPVTHRDHGASFAIVTGHDKSETGQPLIDWSGLATGVDTIAFYMGVKNLPYICEQLIEHGRDPNTPVLLVQWGTTGKQKTLNGTLETIANIVLQEKFSNPAITLVGEVAKLRTKESWFERQPLFGKHILFGRTTEGTSDLANELTSLGADVFEYPRFSTRKIEQAQVHFNDYEQIIFRSPKSVYWFFRHLQQQRIDIRTLQAQLYGASKKSIRAIESFACLGLSVDQLVHSEKRLVIGSGAWQHRAQERLDTYGNHDFCVSHFDEFIEQSNSTCQRILDEDRVDTIVFPSAESVRAVTEQIAACHETPDSLSKRAKVICFGPISYQTAIDLGYEVKLTLKEPTKEALIEALKHN